MPSLKHLLCEQHTIILASDSMKDCIEVDQIYPDDDENDAADLLQ